MAIIVSKNNKNAEKLDPKEFGLESSIQEYVLENPNIIPLYDINEDTRLFVAAREFRTNSGPIDALGFDEAGNIYVIETKLFRNPDKRTVVAQVLDYGASLWKNTTYADDFIAALDSYTQKTFQDSFADKYAEFFRLDDATTNIEAIIANLNEGNIKFVVLMDKLHDALKNLILYVNQNSKFDIYAVELEYYKHAEFEIMIPKLFGNEVKKDVAVSSKADNNPWVQTDVSAFIADVRQRQSDGLISEALVNSFLELHQTYVEVSHRFNDIVKYFSRPKQKDIRCLFEYSDANGNGVYLILDSTCRIESWKHKDRDTQQEKYINYIEEKSNEQKLFNKDWVAPKWWGASFVKFDDSQAEKILEISKEALKELQ